MNNKAHCIFYIQIGVNLRKLALSTELSPSIEVFRRFTPKKYCFDGFFGVWDIHMIKDLLQKKLI
jgi:hypothetical protein